MPQPPGGQPAPRPSSIKPGAAAPRPAPASAVKPAAAPPASRTAPPPQKAAAPASTAKPAAAAPKSQPPASQARPAGGTQKIQAPASGGTQRIAAAKPAAEPAPGAAAAGAPPSAKNLRPSKMQQALADAANKPAEVPGKRGWKFWFNLAVIASIPVCIAIIAWGAKKNIDKGKSVADPLKKIVGGGPTPDGGQPKQQTDHEKILKDAKENMLKAAQTKFAQAEHEATPKEQVQPLLQEALKLAEAYARTVEPIINLDQYKGPEYNWISEDLVTCNQLQRVLKDRLKAMEPEEAKPPAQPNTRALGIIAGWNGTAQKLAVVFLPKDIQPTEPGSTGSEFATTFGRITIKSGDSEIPMAIQPLPAERIWELLRGTVKEEVEKLDIEGKKAKAAELAKDIQVFEGQKFAETYSFATSIQGYYFKDAFARIQVRIHDDRGIECFKEYYDLILQAIGTPSMGWENVSGSFAERKFQWKKDGVVYHLQAIGTKSGMDLTMTAWNEANWKELCALVGEADPFQEAKLEAWNDRTPAEVPK